MTFILRVFVLLIVAFFCSLQALYGQETYGDMQGVEFIRLIDARTLLVNIGGYPPVIGREIEVRLRGIAVPSRYGSCANERLKAEQAEQVLTLLLDRARNITLSRISRGRTFQLEAVVLADRFDLRDILLKKKLALKDERNLPANVWCSDQRK